MLVNPVTIVSCYYQLEKSKHSVQEYRSWIENFLRHVDQPIVMFGEESTLESMKQIREEANLGSKFYGIALPFSECNYSSEEWIMKWNKQLELSNFKHLHGQELFRVWANKSFFVQKAMELNPFQSDSFAWCDAGCWRDPMSASLFGAGWPVAEKIVPHRMHLIVMHDIMDYIEKAKQSVSLDDFVKTYSFRNTPTIGGTILLGDRDAWTHWSRLSAIVLESFIKNDKFAGDDQAILLYTGLWQTFHDIGHRPVFLQAPKRNGFVRIGQFAFGDAWFAFQQHFSKANFILDEYKVV
jgi:hypothetical protein